MAVTRHLQTILVSVPMCHQIPLYLLTNFSHDSTLCHVKLWHTLCPCHFYFSNTFPFVIHTFIYYCRVFCQGYFLCRQNFKIVVVLWFDLGAFFRPSFMAVFNFMPGSTVHCSSSFISTHFLISAGNRHFIF
jgi:hypothetical protein